MASLQRLSFQFTRRAIQPRRMLASASIEQPVTKDDPMWPFTAGFGTVEETTAPITIPLKAPLPEYLQGTLYRQGPGTYNIDDISIPHWALGQFDGLALVHKFELSKDAVTYRSCMTSQEYLSRIQSTKDLGVTFGYTKRPWHKSLLALSRETSKNAKKKTADAPVATNVNVTISPDFLYRDAKTGRTETLLVSKTDGNILQELDRDTLQPKRYFTYTDINPALKGILSAAHEESDPVTGSFINFTLEPGRKNTYTFFEISKEHPEGEILAVLKSKHIAYSHSFLSTKNYVIFMEYPLRLKYSGLSLLFHQSFSKGLYFAKEEPTLFHVMDRQAKSHVATFTYDSFFCFHTINAFDSPDGGITLDLCGFPNADAVLKAGTRADMMSVFDKTADKQTVDSNIRPLYQRYHLDMSLASLNTPLPKATLTPNANGKAVQIDLMCIHPGYRHKEYTFVYGMSWQFSHLRRHDLFDCIIKLNRETMEVLPYHRVGWTPSEPVFVPNPQGTSEEDGCLMVVMLNGTSKQSALVILDAKTMQEIAVIELPEGLVVPFGFHGAFEPKSQVKA